MPSSFTACYQTRIN